MVGYGEDKGIIPIASEKIFDRINANTDSNVSFKVESSMLEIYMEKIRDLFNPKVSGPRARARLLLAGSLSGEGAGGGFEDPAGPEEGVLRPGADEEHCGGLPHD